MSDLQCAARFVVLGPSGAATADGLRRERVAAVYDGATARAHADVLGLALGLPVLPLPGPVALDDVLSERPDALGVLRELADLHRGETVVVTADGDPGRRVDVAVDGDGVTLAESGGTPGA